MKKEKKEFLIRRNRIIKYNKIFIGVLALFIIYALIHSVTILDCNDVFDKLGSSTSYSCTNVSNDLYKFLNDNYMIISCVLLIIAAVVLILQKIELFNINKLNVQALEEEKVYKTGHVLLTLLFGYLGLHKFKTENKVIGYIYLINFIVFGVTFLIKVFSIETFDEFSIFRIAYEFSFLFLIGIIILNIIEAIFTFISPKDEDEKLFA